MAASAKLWDERFAMANSVRLLLISTSTVYGTGYLDHAEAEIRDFLGEVREVLFFPYALANRDAYAEKAIERFGRMGIRCTSVHHAQDPVEAVRRADAFFVGGGNTFRLLKTLYDLQLVDAIRARVEAGAKYMGASAGSNVACPTIRTTNDMPIVETGTLNALGLFPVQINPHYQDPEPSSKHMGETREERLLQYLEENLVPVIGLREGSYIRVENGEMWLKGPRPARLFRRDTEPKEIDPPARLDLVLTE